MSSWFRCGQPGIMLASRKRISARNFRSRPMNGRLIDISFRTFSRFSSLHRQWTVLQVVITMFVKKLSHSSGVNFFAQSLSVHEQYFLCPPVSLVLPCFKKVCSVPNISALLIIPEWTGHVFWPFLFNGTTMQPCIRYIYRFKASFSFANAATSHVFSRNPNFFMLALLIHSE